MQGSPLIRVLVLVASMAVMGGLIAAVVGRAPTELIPTAPAAAEAELKATLSIQLSAPVHSLRLTTLDGQRVLLETENPERTADFPIAFPIRNDEFTSLLSVEWTTPGEPHFLRLILEPESLESQEVILHAPDNLEDHAVEFTWPQD